MRPSEEAPGALAGGSGEVNTGTFVATAEGDLGGSPGDRLTWSAPASAETAGALQGRAGLNLARQPFINSRPVVRAALLLWICGALLLALNLSLFRRYLSSSQETRSRLDQAEAATEKEKMAATELDKRLAGLDLAQQNREVAYLNAKIAERTFSWSMLFDRLAAKLPDGVRLLRLVPTPLADKESGGLAQPSPTAGGGVPPVRLAISAQAKNNESAYLFVQRLFDLPFKDSDLTRKELGEDQLFKLEITVLYTPAAPRRLTTVTPVPVPAPGSAPERP